MDESWRRRRPTVHTRRSSAAGDLGPDDFRDVFGGPPRSILLRRFSSSPPPPPPPLPPPASLYDEVFRYRTSDHRRPPPPRRMSVPNGLRGVMKEDGFYDDIFGFGFGSDSGESNKSGLRRSRSRSVSNKSDKSAASNCEDAIAVACDGGDSTRSSIATKLRPITIPSWRYDSSLPSTVSEDQYNKLCYTPSVHFNENYNHNGQNYTKNTTKSQCKNTSFCCFSPPETVSLEPSFRLSFKKPPSSENNSPESPSSVISSVFVNVGSYLPRKVREVEKSVLMEEVEREREEKGSFVIKNDGWVRKEEESSAVALDEAIAWAKEKFMYQVTEEVASNKDHFANNVLGEGK